MKKNIKSEVREWADKISISDGKKCLDDEFFVGERVVWMYKEDKEYLEKYCDQKITKENWKRHAPFGGIVVPLEGTHSRHFFDFNDILDHCFICITEYPTEKCDPDVDWISFGQLISNKDLLYFGKVLDTTE